MTETFSKPRPTVRGVLRSTHPRSTWAGCLLGATFVEPLPAPEVVSIIPTTAPEDSGGSAEALRHEVDRWESEGGSPVCVRVVAPDGLD